MARWRDTKQGKTPKPKTKPKKSSQTQTLDLPFASNIEKAKAFLTDTFMLMMPVMYIIIYAVFGNLQSVGEHKLEAWGYIFAILGVIVISFYAKSGQTPGLKAYNLKVVDIQTKEKPSIMTALLRYLFFTINFFTVFGLVYGFFRDDKRGLHDLLSGSAIVKE